MQLLEKLETKPERIVIMACALLALTMLVMAFHMMDELDQIARMKRIVVYVNDQKERVEVTPSTPSDLEPLDSAV